MNPETPRLKMVIIIFKSKIKRVFFFLLLLTSMSLLSQSNSMCMSALCFGLHCLLHMRSPGASTGWTVVSRSLSSPGGGNCWIGWSKYSAPSTAGFSDVTAAIQHLILLFWSEKEEGMSHFLLLVIWSYIELMAEQGGRWLYSTHICMLETKGKVLIQKCTG